MKKHRRKFTSTFKAQVAIEALKERETLSELAVKYELSVQQISLWKNEFLKNSSSVFESASNNKKSETEDVDNLYKKIGRLEMEKEFLKKNLKRLGIS